MPIVAARYAKALLDLAISEDAVDAYRQELAAISYLYSAENGLRAFLLSPRSSLATKKDMLLHAMDGPIRKNLLHLLLLLLDKGRVESLPGICAAYYQMVDEYRNILNITVLTALPLDEGQIGRIGEKVRAIYRAASVKIAVKTDRSLIGGVVVTVGDKLYDASVKGKLSKMRSSLIGAPKGSG